jgi:hypothetical protein
LEVCKLSKSISGQFLDLYGSSEHLQDNDEVSAWDFFGAFAEFNPIIIISACHGVHTAVQPFKFQSSVAFGKNLECFFGRHEFDLSGLGLILKYVCTTSTVYARIPHSRHLRTRTILLSRLRV